MSIKRSVFILSAQKRFVGFVSGKEKQKFSIKTTKSRNNVRKTFLVFFVRKTKFKN